MFSLIAPPAFSGTLLGLVPIIIMTMAIYVLLYGPPLVDTTEWILDSYKLHYMDTAVDPDNYHKARWVVNCLRTTQFSGDSYTDGELAIRVARRFCNTPEGGGRRKTGYDGPEFYRKFISPLFAASYVQCGSSQVRAIGSGIRHSECSVHLAGRPHFFA